MKLFCLTLMAGSALAGEYAVLSSGFRLHAERHETEGAVVRLYSKDGGIIQLDAALITAFEREEEAPPALREPALPSAPPPTTRDLVDRAARNSGLPSQLVHSVVAAESAYQPHAVSPKGAIGLMQLMPATARALNADPQDPAQNVEAGARYLRELLLKYDRDPYKALAAYNAGTGAVGKYNGVPPYPETQTYIQRVLRKYKQSTEPVPAR